MCESVKEPLVLVFTYIKFLILSGGGTIWEEEKRDVLKRVVGKEDTGQQGE